MAGILIQGVGAIGGLLAGGLLRAGEQVTLVTANPDITAAINRDGISLASPDGAFWVAAEAHTSLADLPPDRRFGSAYLAMMAGAVVESASASLPLLTDDGYVVAYQNGFVEEAIGKAIGIERVISATVALGCNMETPGVYRRTTPGRIIIGEMDGRASARIEALRETLAHVIKTEISHNIVGVLWGKLLWNGSVSALCAASGKRLGDLFDCAIGRELFLLAFRESVDTARAEGIRIEHVIVNPDDYYLDATDSPRRREEILTAMEPFVKKYAGVIPSTLRSLERGRRSEIDFLNGYILEKARGSRLKTPLNEAVIQMIHDIEAGRRSIDPANLDELFGELDKRTQAAGEDA